MDKISIIIPVYNAEKYLIRCINSVINQTFKNIEIISIDDKSTDSSLTILKNFSNKIKLLSLDANHGVSFTRNKGLEIATGNYIVFLDSDDFLENTFCEKLYKSLVNNKTDISCCGHRNNESPKAHLIKSTYSTSPMKDIMNFTKYRTVSKKLFKSSIIKNNNIKFDETLHYMEDALFLITYLTFCKSISGVREPLYRVTVNSDSLCRNKSFLSRREKERKFALTKINKIIDEFNSSKC